MNIRRPTINSKPQATDPPRFAEVVQKIRAISDLHYEGNAYDNALAVFNKLNTEEKRVFIRGFLNLCFVIEQRAFSSLDIGVAPIKAPPIPKEKIDTEHTIRREIDSLEDLNQLEQIKLKTWLTKMLVKFTAISVLVGVIIVGISDVKKEGLVNSFSHLFEIVEVMFFFKKD